MSQALVIRGGTVVNADREQRADVLCVDGRIVVRSEIDNPGKVLKAEMFATFLIATGEPGTGPVVPIASVIRDGDAASVWVECEPRVFERRAVRLGGEANGFVQVTAGLNAGERVVGRGAIFVDNEFK